MFYRSFTVHVYDVNKDQKGVGILFPKNSDDRTLRVRSSVWEKGQIKVIRKTRYVTDFTKELVESKIYMFYILSII